MKERLLQLMQHYGYTATRLADELAIQRSGISHILNGRNQPSFDFIVKLLKKFPDINAEWLILGKGNLLKNPSHEMNLFSSPDPTSDQRQLPSTDTKKVTNVTSIKQVFVLYTDGTFHVYHPSGRD